MPNWIDNRALWEMYDPGPRFLGGLQAGAQVGNLMLRAREQALMLPLQEQMYKNQAKAQEVRAESMLLNNEIARQNMDLERGDQINVAGWLRQYPTVESRENAPDPVTSTPKWMQAVNNMRRADGISTFEKARHDAALAAAKNQEQQLKIDQRLDTESARFWDSTVAKEKSLQPDQIELLRDTADERGRPTKETRDMFLGFVTANRQAEATAIEDKAKTLGLEPIKVSATGAVSYGRTAKSYLTLKDGTVVMKSGSDLVKVNPDSGQVETLFAPPAKGELHERDLIKLYSEQQKWARGTPEYNQFQELIDDVKKRKVQAAPTTTPTTTPIPPTITSKSEFDALSSGTIYIGTDGKKYRKP